MPRPDPNALFDAKHRTLQEQLTYQFPRWRVRPPDDDDLRQAASMLLWQQCRRAAGPDVPPFVLSCNILVLTALRRWHHQCRRDRTLAVPTEVLNENPAPTNELAIVVDGTRVTLTGNEARAEAGDLLDLWNYGYTTPEAAKRIGVTKQRAYQLRHRLGGVLVTTGALRRWYFPREQIDAEAVRRGRRNTEGSRCEYAPGCRNLSPAGRE